MIPTRRTSKLILNGMRVLVLNEVPDSDKVTKEWFRDMCESNYKNEKYPTIIIVRDDWTTESWLACAVPESVTGRPIYEYPHILYAVPEDAKGKEIKQNLKNELGVGRTIKNAAVFRDLMSAISFFGDPNTYDVVDRLSSSENSESEGDVRCG